MIKIKGHEYSGIEQAEFTVVLNICWRCPQEHKPSLQATRLYHVCFWILSPQEMQVSFEVKHFFLFPCPLIRLHVHWPFPLCHLAQCFADQGVVPSLKHLGVCGCKSTSDWVTNVLSKPVNWKLTNTWNASRNSQLLTRSPHVLGLSVPVPTDSLSSQDSASVKGLHLSILITADYFCFIGNFPLSKILIQSVRWGAQLWSL